MTIEFHCHVCGKFLSTEDSKAGRQAKCPGCDEILTVPAATRTGTEPPLPPLPPPPPGATVGPVQMRACPMCGENVPATARICPACGEELQAKHTAGLATKPVQFEVGEVLSTAWQISKRELGLLVAIVFVAVLLNLLLQLPGLATSFMVQMEVQNGQRPALGLILFSNLWNILVMLPTLYLACGQTVAFLRVARGERASISDLFSGGRYFLRSLLNYFVFMVVVMFGLALCVLPGIFVLVCLWPFLWVLVAEDRPGIETLSRTWALTKVNRGPSLVLLIAMFFLYVAGALACLVGVLVTLPVCMMAATVAYLRMSGQPTVLELERA